MGLLKDLLFGQSYNEATDPARENYKNAQQSVYDAYQQAFDDAEFYRSNKELFDEVGKDIPGLTKAFVDTTYGDGLNKTVKSRQDAADEAKKQYAAAMRENKYNVVGNGILGSLLSPFFGVADVGGDLVTGQIGDRYSRDANGDGIPDNDLTQDIGSFLNAGLTLAGGGNLGSGASLASKALTGAGLGAAQNAAYSLQQNGNDTWNNLGTLTDDVLLGATIGGALPVATAGLGKVKSGVTNALTKRGVSPSTASKLGRVAQVGTGVGAGAIGLNGLLSRGGNQNQAQQDDNAYSGYTNNNTYYGGY